MKAAILVKKDSDLLIEDVELPSKLDYGQIKVKVFVSGLCGAQLLEIQGRKNNEKFMPHLLGHEGCGIVESVGKGVSKVKSGDKVVMHWRKASGIESDFPNYHWNSRKISGGKVTTLSEYSIVSENRVTKVPLNLDSDFCALLGCGLSTGFAVVNKEANIKFGESVLVLGCGCVGLNCILAAKLSLASPVIGYDISKAKQDLVENAGGRFFCQINNLREYSQQVKFDCIIDTTGYLPLVSEVLPYLSEQGRCILVAQPKIGDQLSILNPISFFSSKGQTIKTTQAGTFDPDVDIINYCKLYTNNMIDTRRLVTHRFHLKDINNAIQVLKDGQAGRILIDL